MSVVFKSVTCANDPVGRLVKHEDDGASPKMAKRLEAMLDSRSEG